MLLLHPILLLYSSASDNDRRPEQAASALPFANGMRGRYELSTWQLCLGAEGAICWWAIRATKLLARGPYDCCRKCATFMAAVGRAVVIAVVELIYIFIPSSSSRLLSTSRNGRSANSKIVTTTSKDPLQEPSLARTTTNESVLKNRLLDDGE